MTKQASIRCHIALEAAAAPAVEAKWDEPVEAEYVKGEDEPDMDKETPVVTNGSHAKPCQKA